MAGKRLNIVGKKPSKKKTGKKKKGGDSVKWHRPGAGFPTRWKKQGKWA
tara:strand:- start:108 stop:254 length:147 start_codon:yes stop_codon:yes gene_type:complete